ncbi:restriction endonuclease [Kineococcus siccus]|uniref:restriction endonuclease n=1 Tax=Kineococcus siccus TaxID=2696567 RepID=UPI003B8385D3
MAFEQLVARLLRRDGWREVTVSGGAGDLGADVTARHPGDGSLLVVQCSACATPGAPSAPPTSSASSAPSSTTTAPTTRCM